MSYGNEEILDSQNTNVSSWTLYRITTMTGDEFERRSSGELLMSGSIYSYLEGTHAQSRSIH